MVWIIVSQVLEHSETSVDLFKFDFADFSPNIFLE